MSATARRGALLAVVAALLLVNPLYVGHVVDEPRQRSPTGYAATAVDPANATDQRTILYQVGQDDVLDLDQFAEANEYQPYGDAYRAPGAAAAVLRRATEDGTARVDADAPAAFTLDRALAGHRYVAVDGADDERRYYRVSADPPAGADGAGNATVVTATEVDRETVARFVLHRDARLYSALPQYQRETVEKVLAADEYGYRPYNDEFADLTDDVLVRDDTYYVFSASEHVDNFGPSAHDLVSGVLGLLGFLFLVASAVLTGLSYRRAGTDGEEDDEVTGGRETDDGEQSGGDGGTGR